MFKTILIAAIIFHNFGWMCIGLFMSLMAVGLYKFARHQIAHAEVRRREYDDIVDRAHRENQYFLAGDPLGVNGMYTPFTLPMTGYQPKPDWSGIIQTRDSEAWHEYRQSL